MPRTPETLTRHELIGLPLRVADATSADYVGICGRVVGETMQTLTVSTDSGDRQLPKQGSVFEFAVSDVQPDDYTAGDEATDEAAEAGAGDHPTSDSHQGGRKDSGSSSELGEDTAGVRPRQSWPSGCSANPFEGGCEGGVYVTVDGSRLLSRPAERTQRTGDSKWR